MAQPQTLSTPGNMSRHNAGFRTSIASTTISRLVPDPATSVDVTGLRNRTSCSLVRISEVHSGLQTIRHSRAQLTRSGTQVHFLHLQIDGESVNRQDQREARLQPGDFTICDNSRPYEVCIEKPSRMLVFGFSNGLMRRYIQYPQSISAIRIPGNVGMGGLVADFLSNVWRRCLSDGEFEINAGVTDAMLGLVANAYRQSLGSRIDHNSLGASHRARIVNYIEENLSESTLTPTRIAVVFRITTRYLHHLFSEEKETVARYILRRRLEECARALSSPSQRKRTITSIAFDLGFSSATHFGRVFRSRYDIIPREYRQRYCRNA
jgi:AraC-like DNA-binding protein